MCGQGLSDGIWKLDIVGKDGLVGFGGRIMS